MILRQGMSLIILESMGFYWQAQLFFFGFGRGEVEFDGDDKEDEHD